MFSQMTRKEKLLSMFFMIAAPIVAIIGLAALVIGL